MPRQKDPGFDADVTQFVLTDLRSVWALEALVLIAEAGDIDWSVAKLTRELRASLPLVEDIVRRLETFGLVAPDRETFRFQPANPVLADLVVRTRAAYRQKPFAMISLIGRGPAALQGLADAFRFRNDRP